MSPNPFDLPLFVATRAEDVPPGLTRFASVDGSVPGAAVTWDHHVTGEAVNLDAMPERVDPSAFDGVGTTAADMDAIVSAVALLLGGRARLPDGPRAILECASHWCDHLRPHPGQGAAENRLGRGLLDHVAPRLHVPRERASAAFAEVVRELARVVLDGRELPFAEPSDHAVVVERALAEGRVRAEGRVAVVDLRGLPPVDPLAVYQRIAEPVAVFVEEHARGGVKYTVGVNPEAADRPEDLRPALIALARAEHALGPPCLAPDPVPGAENWGGRATVFGSPWNHGSRLDATDVARLVSSALGWR